MCLCVCTSLHVCALKALCKWLYVFVERGKRFMVWDFGIVSSLVTMLFCCSVAKSCPTLCNPMGCSIPGSSVLCFLPQFAISFCTTPFSFCLQFFYLSEYFPLSWLLASGGQSIGASASASVLPMSIQGWFPLDGLVLSPCSSKDSQVSSPGSQFESKSQPSLWSNFHISAWILEKIIALTIQSHVNKVMTLLFNMLCRFVIGFIPRSKCLLISWLQSLSTVILEPKKIKSVTLSISSPAICHEVMGLGDGWS